MLKKKLALLFCIWGVALGNFGTEESFAATSADYVAVPPFISSGAPPLVMLVMGRDHKLYYEAYNDSSDLDGDGEPDIRYKPDLLIIMDILTVISAMSIRRHQRIHVLIQPQKHQIKHCDGTKWSGDLSKLSDHVQDGHNAQGALRGIPIY